MDYRKEMNELLEPTSCLMFDAIGNVSYELEPLVKSPTPGLYYGVSLHPLLVEGKTYLSGFGDATQTVTPENGTHWTAKDVQKWRKAGLRNMVSGKEIFLTNQKYAVDAFSNKPSANVHLVKFMLLWTQNYLATISPHAKRGNTQDKMLECLKDNAACEMLLSGEIDRMLEPLSGEIEAWIGRDIWHMYFVKSKHTSIAIEKTSDYRIWCYYEMLEKSQNKENGE